jgi:hypothetical protein
VLLERRLDLTFEADCLAVGRHVVFRVDFRRGRYNAEKIIRSGFENAERCIRCRR